MLCFKTLVACALLSSAALGQLQEGGHVSVRRTGCHLDLESHADCDVRANGVPLGGLSDTVNAMSTTIAAMQSAAAVQSATIAGLVATVGEQAACCTATANTTTSAPSLPSGGFALVANFDGKNVGRIDLVTDAVTFPYTGSTESSGFNRVYGVAIAPSGDFALVTNNINGHPLTVGGTDIVARIDLGTGAVTFPYTGFSFPYGVAIAPSGDFALVANSNVNRNSVANSVGNSVGRIDLVTSAVTFPYTGFSSPRDVAIAPSGDFALVGNAGGNTVARIDLGTGAVTFPYTGFNGPSGVAIAPSGAFALVANTGDNTVARIDLDFGAVTFPYTGFSSPRDVAIDPSGDFALVSNVAGNNVARIDLGTGAVTYGYGGFNRPYGVAIG